MMEAKIKVVIVGGSAAGPTAASTVRRKDSTVAITLLEMGEFISFAA
jgi:thioredoxin reductase